MNGRGRRGRVVALCVALAITVSALHPGPARAAMITTGQVVGAAADDRGRILHFMARGDLRRQLVALGIDPAEALERAASLSDEEVREIAGKLDRLAAGQGAAVAIAGAILFVFVILVLTDLLGLTDVYPFVKSQKAE